MEEEYLDEIILKEKNRRRKERCIKEIMEQGLPEEVLQTVGIGEIAEIKIPALFQDMPQNIIDRKYVFEPQPQIIMTNRRGTVDFTFSVLEVTVSGEQLQENVDAAQKGMQRLLPTALFRDGGHESVNGVEVCWFSYIRTTPEGQKTYNMVFYAAMERAVVITMCCALTLWEKWSVIAKYCVSTLKGR